MRYKRAVEKLRILAETCERVKMFWFDTEPFLKAVYALGEVLGGADPLDAVQVAVAINLPPEEVPWEPRPRSRYPRSKQGGTGRSGRGCQVRFRAHGRTAGRRACSGGNSYVQSLKTGWHGICWISASFLWCVSECT